jgi:hypothetical protein
MVMGIYFRARKPNRNKNKCLKPPLDPRFRKEKMFSQWPTFWPPSMTLLSTSPIFQEEKPSAELPEE